MSSISYRSISSVNSKTDSEVEHVSTITDSSEASSREDYYEGKENKN